MFSMTNEVSMVTGRPCPPPYVMKDLVDSNTAAQLLRRSRPALTDMADRGVLTRYRIGTAVLYWRLRL